MSVLVGADMTSMAKIGRWWFQRRSLSPLPLFLLMILLPPDFRWGESGAWLLPLTGILLAEALRVWAVGFAGSATRTRGDDVPALVHAGPFRFVRNPLYIANIVLYTCCGIAFGFVYLSAFTFAFSCIQYAFIVAFEEETLLRIFGRQYDDYRQAVPRWLPALSPRIAASPHVFSLSRSIKSEKSTFLSMLFMAAAFTTKRVITGT